MPGRRVIVAVWLAALVACCLVIGRTNFSTDMSAFLPRSPRPAQQILVDQLHEGVVSRLILLAIEGAPPDTLAALSKSLAAALRADPAFAIVSNGDEAAFARDRDLLWRNRYLLVPRSYRAISVRRPCTLRWKRMSNCSAPTWALLSNGVFRLIRPVRCYG